MSRSNFMVSTITATVLANMTTVLVNTFALLTTLILLILLIQKEIVSITKEQHSPALNHALNVVIVPLALASLAIALFEFTNVL